MPRLVAFLRAINVGGHTVPMAELRRIFERLGFTQVETFIASGNVVFRTARGETPALRRRIEAALEDRLGYEVVTFLRAEAEVAAIASHEAFSEAERRVARTINVGLLAAPAAPALAKALRARSTADDRFHFHGRELYWLSRTRMSESPFFNVSFEKLLQTQATFRNLNTMARLTAKFSLGEPGG
jgi:uncharacterized protein (DUF1697 family)